MSDAEVKTTVREEPLITGDDLQAFQNVLSSITARMNKVRAASSDKNKDTILVSMRQAFGTLMKSMNTAARQVGLPSNCFAIPPTISQLTWQCGFESIRPVGAAGWLILNKADNPDVIISYLHNTFVLKRCVDGCRQRGPCSFDSLMAHFGTPIHHTLFSATPPTSVAAPQETSAT